MLFSSVSFLFMFLPITLLLYFLVPARFKNLVLLICSLFFYAWGEPVYVVLMILSIVFNYACGLDIGYNADDPVHAKRGIIFAVVVNLLILGFFKYYGFLIGSINAVFPVNIPYRELELPIGISFYTFQAMSYVIDVYRKRVRPQRDLMLFAVYVSMFPQLIAGPIVRYADIEAQLKQRNISPNRFGDGIMYFIRGLAKKVLIANTVGGIFDQISGMGFGSFSMLTAWVGCVSYAFQIYFDFSGYSDMAIGLGKMFGFDFLKNFEYPYTAKSITDFWRRWHISLSTWFREYVYIPLGGNRKGTKRTVINLLIVWALTGLWHGANWTFLFWGLYYGGILVLEKFVIGERINRLPGALQHAYTLILVLIGWVFFFSPDLGYAFRYLGVMFGIGAKGLADQQALFFVLTNWLLYLVSITASTSFGYYVLDRGVYNYRNGQGRRGVACIIYLAMFIVSIAFLVTENFNPFLYFRF
ncbi:MBOAT family O-acyltransferase [Hespellia stercorisuis]|uniref:Alginate O-acetyltransferase complex protein AlgI n=1 Tax=Hespellia stercorisuis DSM 15480 TaxID=1121950 RepID=A0A1M6QPL1_9FIRM|nr:MBOAT family protein [Hespellia stercorisuis]SHK22232.1 alginate O-acetyltransferase complex protein AlgI [Hespellia stercorisuis DSM 15480]